MRLRLKARLRMTYPGLVDFGLLGWIGFPALVVMSLFMISAPLLALGDKLGLAYGERLNPEANSCTLIVPDC